MECTLKIFAHHQQHCVKHFVLPQTHQYHEIVFYKHGTGRTTINDESYEYKDGTIALIPADVAHDEITDTPTEVYFCLFQCDEPIRTESNLFQCDEKLLKEVISVFELMEFEYANNMSYMSNIMNFLMTVLYMQILRLNSSQKSPDECIKYVKTYIHEYCNLQINFEILAGSIGYSESRLRHLFKEKYATSLKQYQISARINYAKKLLLNTELSINNIGKKCGFKTSSKFIDTFRRHCNLTPQNFRELYSTVSTDTIVLS